MKTHIRTVILFCAVILVATNVIFAQVASEAPSSAPVSRPSQAEATPQAVAVSTTNSRLSDLVQRTRYYSSRTGGASSVLVIPSAEIKTEEIAQITEDMNIMSRIFQKDLQQARIGVGGVFITTSSDPFHAVFARGKQSTQGMYLQGYGALFLMKVDFPLSPPPQAAEETKLTPKEKGTDEVWSQMRDEMFAPEETRKDKNKRPEKVYNAEQVNNLKTTLVKALKHAANIRCLKPDEWLVLTITGSGTTSGYKKVSTIPGRNEFVIVDRNNEARIVKADMIGDFGLSLPTVLVIRAKKSEIDRFAKGDLDFDQFQQNTQILTSAYLADQAGLGNPITGYYHDYVTVQR